MLDTKKITIFGCGWLGFPLAQRLIKQGHVVLGTTTQELKRRVLEQAGIQAFSVDLMNEEALNPSFFQSEIIVLAFPPKTKSTTGDWYVQAVNRIVTNTRNSFVKKIILLSSTSVYPDIDQVMAEDFPLSKSHTANQTLYEAEQQILSSSPASLVLRLGGLAGGDRWLARHFSGKSDLSGGSSPVNLLHREDAIRCIEICIEKEIPAGIYNLCSPQHPAKEELYTKECREAGWPLPSYKNEGQKGGKVISVDKWLRIAEYDFSFPSPLDYSYAK